MINSEERYFDSDVCIEYLISHDLDLSTKGLAVAVNNTIIPRSSWGTTKLKDNDQVLIIQATQGG